MNMTRFLLISIFLPKTHFPNSLYKQFLNRLLPRFVVTQAADRALSGI